MTTLPLQEALNDAISSGRFIDTKVVLFSRRDVHGRVCKPKALYANSHVLRSVPYFEDCEFALHSSVLHGITPSQYSSANLPRRGPGISLKPTVKSSQRTMATHRIVTWKRMGILRALAPWKSRKIRQHHLINHKRPVANTKRMHGRGKLSGSKM